MSSKRPSGTVQYNNAGRVVIVTGGCSGIGHTICALFAKSRASGVVCADVNEDAVGDLPNGVAFRKCDTSHEDDCRDVVAWTIDQFGALDVLVNNAAIQPADSYRPLHELPSDVWHKLISINFSGYTMMAKYALRQMRSQQSGVVINIASAQGHRTAREVGTYGPIKAGNIMQARQWGVEYARDGIRVVSVSPGAIDTPLARASMAEQGGGAAVANRHPLGRFGHTEEIANAVLWLSSDDASFVTATDLEVDGGLGGFAAFADPYELPKTAEQTRQGKQP